MTVVDLLSDKTHPKGREQDDSSSEELAAELVPDVGLDPVHAGPLRIARYTEPFALLVAQLAYERKAGPELAYPFERFGNEAHHV